jgi:hypothetical protein
MSKIIAEALGLDYEGRNAFNDEYQYQPTRTGAEKIYTTGADYYCVKKTKPKADVGQPWELMPDQFWAKQAKTVVWVSKSTGVNNHDNS